MLLIRGAAEGGPETEASIRGAGYVSGLSAPHQGVVIAVTCGRPSNIVIKYKVENDWLDNVLSFAGSFNSERESNVLDWFRSFRHLITLKVRVM